MQSIRDTKKKTICALKIVRWIDRHINSTNNRMGNISYPNLLGESLEGFTSENKLIRDLKDK